MNSHHVIRGINGPIVTVTNGQDLAIADLVRVGPEGLMGEVAAADGPLATVQVYEDTAGLSPGQPVACPGGPLSILLGPGLLGGFFDGVGRPLRALEEAGGPFLRRGADLPALDGKRSWQVTMAVQAGDALSPGVLYASCPEAGGVTHRCLTPPGLSGRVVWAAPSGSYPVTGLLAEVQDGAGQIHPLRLAQPWPIRTPRPVARRLPLDRPLITGQRVLDTLFPLAKGGAAALPGPFGAGKTMAQHQLAKWADADIIVYLGCGERGNEMTQALEEFAGLPDPRTGRPLLQRTVLIANTSNMPVAAREASIYTGMAIAEYYRDMGLHVALMADSTSRWAEALRELSGRLGEIPAEEGFPAYLASRLAEFYQRAGYVRTLEGREGSVTVIGAVSPQGGDFSEPVTQGTRRCVRAFWALDRELAYARHFPAVNWHTSYSAYAAGLGPWYDAHLGEGFLLCRRRIRALLQEEDRLLELARLTGGDLLPEPEKLVLETARLIRVGFLQQNAAHPADTYTPPDRQLRMMELILRLYDGARPLAARGIPLSQLRDTGIFNALIQMKYRLPGGGDDPYGGFAEQIAQALARVEAANREVAPP